MKTVTFKSLEQLINSNAFEMMDTRDIWMDGKSVPREIIGKTFSYVIIDSDTLRCQINNHNEIYGFDDDQCENFFKANPLNEIMYVDDELEYPIIYDDKNKCFNIGCMEIANDRMDNILTEIFRHLDYEWV